MPNSLLRPCLAFMRSGALSPWWLRLSVTTVALCLCGPNIASADCTAVSTANDLDNIRNDLAGEYCLTNDIDLGSIPDWTPIGADPGMANEPVPFTGKLFGKGFAITNLTSSHGGLFRHINGASIQDLRLVNVNIEAHDVFVGGLTGYAGDAGDTVKRPATTMARIFVSGKVACVDPDSGPSGLCQQVGGIVGQNNGGRNDEVSPPLPVSVLTESSSTAVVSVINGEVGGIAGENSGQITRTFFAGSASCTSTFPVQLSYDCYVGGIAGINGNYPPALIDLSYATQAVTVDATGFFTYVGGLVGMNDGGLSLRRSYSAGSVGSTGVIGGLVGYVSHGFFGDTASDIDQVYAVGPVSNGGGLIGQRYCLCDPATAYWDIETTGQSGSQGGTGLSTSELQAVLPPGFDPAVWGITAGQSYPYLLDSEIEWRSPLSTLVVPNIKLAALPNSSSDQTASSSTPGKLLYVFLPISQLDKSQYAKPRNIRGAALATVYSIIGRAIGKTRDIASLKDVKIDKYWKALSQGAIWHGPISNYATLSGWTSIAPSASLTETDVISNLRKRRLVILEAVGDDNKTTWFLATLYRTSPNGRLRTVVALDPWSGKQFEIDPVSKKAITDSFRLKRFTVTSYAVVTLK